MNTITKTGLFALLITVASFGQQQPLPGARFPQPGYSGYGMPASGKPSTKNYQLELDIKRGGKTARYKLTLNGGTVSTELIDRFTDRQEGAAPATINLNASLTPFEEGGGEVSVTLNRSISFQAKQQGKDVTLTKVIPLFTKVALFPGKPVVLFEDEDENISLRLTPLDSEAQKP